MRASMYRLLLFIQPVAPAVRKERYTRPYSSRYRLVNDKARPRPSVMEFMIDPHIIAGLVTLIVLEVVLGIDNLIFIAILADRLPPHQRDRARITGLSLAMFMRLGLLAGISWLVGLTSPLFSLAGFDFSGRDLILAAGGLFLLFKATTEIH